MSSREKYYCTVRGDDLSGYPICALRAKTLTGAKREAPKLVGGGYLHHWIVIGLMEQIYDPDGDEVFDFIVVCSRRMGGGRWYCG